MAASEFELALGYMLPVPTSTLALAHRRAAAWSQLGDANSHLVCGAGCEAGNKIERHSPSPSFSPPPARGWPMLQLLCACISILFFALRRANGRGREGSAPAANKVVRCEQKQVDSVAPNVDALARSWKMLAAFVQASARRWAASRRACRSKWSLRRTCKPRSTPIQSSSRAHCPSGAGRRRFGHALRSFVPFVLLSIASGWKLPDSQRVHGAPAEESVWAAADVPGGVENLTPLTAEVRVAITGEVSVGSRRRLADNCNGGWCASLPHLPLASSIARNRATASCPQRHL